MPAAARVWDLDLTHCSTPVRAQGSPNVFVNGLPWSRAGDLNLPHLRPGSPCPTHMAPIAAGSSKTRVNGRGAGRIFDYIAGCTFCATGSPNVYAN